MNKSDFFKVVVPAIISALSVVICIKLYFPSEKYTTLLGLLDIRRDYVVYILAFVSVVGFIASKSLAGHFFSNKSSTSQIIALSFIVCIICSSMLGFAQTCKRYGLYDTAVAFRANQNPRVRILSTNLSRVGLIKDSKECLYLSGTTWTTIGYGDVIPSHELRPFAILEGLLQSFLMAVITVLLISTFRL